MTDSKNNEVYLSSSPHFSNGFSTRAIMACVIISLIPQCIAGTIFFGFRAIAVIAVSIVSAVVFELLFQIAAKQKISIDNLSAVVSGLLFALVLPVTIPLWMIIIGTFTALVVAKGLFGGLGANVFNPALTGRAVLFISFPFAMGASWKNPLVSLFAANSTMEAVSSATVLSKIKAGGQFFDNSQLLEYFIGSRAGSIGETSIILILVSFIFLLAFKIIDWRTPLAMIFSLALCTFISSFIESANVLKSVNNVLINLLTGGLLFGAVFMATDYSTTPVTKPGRIVFGIGCGLITFLIRRFGGYPEGVMFSILIMNALSGLLNELISRKYGYGKKGHRKPRVEKLIQEFDLSNSREVK